MLLYEVTSVFSPVLILNLKKFNQLLAHEVVESHHNVKLLWDECGLNRIKFLLCSDHKTCNIVFGIQPHGCKFPCHICNAKNPREPGVDWEKGDLRTLGMIREKCVDWRNAGGVLRRAKEFQSCVAWPLFDDTDETLVLSLSPLSELHILLRVFNHLFKQFEQEWIDLESGLTTNADGDNPHTDQQNNPAEQWAISCGALQKSCHGKVFNGNGCNKLLSSEALHKLEFLLPFGPMLDYLDCFQKLAKVKHACFGMKLSPDYSSKIDEFKRSYLGLKITVTPVVHILFAHTSDFVNMCDEAGERGRGLGCYSEQSFEAMHSKVAKAVDRFPANQFSESFPFRLLRAIGNVNSLHLK